MVIVLRKKDKLFLGERIDIANAWQLPQGGVERGEDFIIAARRELYEETGVTSVKFIAQTKLLYRYDFPEDAQKKAFTRYGNLKYRGQEQSFVLFDFLGNDSEINLQCLTIEFRRWFWADPSEVLAAAVNFKYDCYRQGLTELGLINV